METFGADGDMGRCAYRTAGKTECVARDCWQKNVLEEDTGRGGLVLNSGRSGRAGPGEESWGLDWVDKAGLIQWTNEGM